MEFIMRDVKIISEYIDRLKPAIPTLDSDLLITQEEAIDILAPILKKKQAQGCTLTELTEALAQHKLAVKPKSLGKFLAGDLSIKKRLFITRARKRRKLLNENIGGITRGEARNDALSSLFDSLPETNRESEPPEASRNEIAENLQTQSEVVPKENPQEVEMHS